MKKYIDIYKDSDFGTFYTRDDLESEYYYSILMEKAEDGEENQYADFEEFLSWHILSGALEPITAELASAKEVYPYYYDDEAREFKTIMQLYSEYLETREDADNWSFSEFLDNSSKNNKATILYYGFE